MAPTDEQADTTATESPESLGGIRIAGRPVDAAIGLRVAGLVWLTVVGWRLAGGAGVGVGLALAAVAVVVRPLVTVAVAHAGLLLLVGDLTDVNSLVELGLLELGVLAVLLSERPVGGATTLLAAGFGLTLVVSTVAVQFWAGQLAATAVLLAVVAGVAYGIHRYEQVSLGLVVEREMEEEYE